MPSLIALYAKSTLRLEGPLIWRGSFLQEIFKNKGPATVCSEYRDVSIADTSCKDYHATLWPRLLASLEESAHPTQCGGLLRRGADITAHFARAHWERAHVLRRTAVQIYVGQTTAFAGLCRQLGFGGARSDEQIADLFRLFGVDTTIQEFARALAESAADDIGIPMHSQLVLDSRLHRRVLHL